MKVFYFLAIFALIAIASNFFELPQHEGPESMGASVLRSIKSWSLGAMTLFAVVLSIVATALLLPKDVEDRTLYTILAKPVPRLDYLTGKLLGVMSLVFVSMMIMNVLMVSVLHMRTEMILTDQAETAKALNWPADAVESIQKETMAQGPTWSLQGAVLATFLKASVMAALALVISTFSSSTLFTTIVSFLLYFIGHFQADARSAFFQSDAGGEGLLTRIGGLIFSIFIPDFQLFNVIDAVIEGQVFPLILLMQLVGIGLFYLVFYTLASWFIFSDKEF